MSFSAKDKEKVIDRYTKRFKTYGYSPKTLGWFKGKQDIRFHILTSHVNLENKAILDIGCGFGDLNRILKNKLNSYTYFGVDIVPALIEEGKKRYSGSNIQFLCADFSELKIEPMFDYAIASGIFNFKLLHEDNYHYIEHIIQKSLKLCTIGIAFDFLSDKVDYEYEETFHNSPEKILSIAYKYSRNIVIRNDYMPFEFSLFITKDDSFKPETTVFNRYLNSHEYSF